MADPDLLERQRTPLLEVLTRQALDEDYAHVAARAAAADAAAQGPGPGPSRPRRPGLGGVTVVAAFGVLLAVAAVQTARNADVDDASREALVQRIEGRREVVAAQQERIATLRDGNARLEGELSDTTAEEQAADAVRTRLSVRTGFEAVTGPGVRVVVQNAPDADERAQVRDSDLALLVNGLWTAGAEAVAVNGQRLTAVTAIRNSGTAVEVNGVGVAPPYEVEAIGDPLSLEAGLLDSSSGLAFVSLAQTYGFTYDVETLDGEDGDDADRLELPAAPARLATLRWAVDDAPSAPAAPLPGEDDAP